MTRGNVERERDRSIEHLLRDALKRQSASSSASCFDAETAAAWMDGALSAGDRAKAEAHAANCARCQALVAALARTTPPSPVRSWFRLPAVAWLAPLTAAAAAVIVWSIVPAPLSKRAPATSAAPVAGYPIAEARPPAAPPAAPARVDELAPAAKQALAEPTKALADRKQGARQSASAAGTAKDEQAAKLKKNASD